MDVGLTGMIVSLALSKKVFPLAMGSKADAGVWATSAGTTCFGVESETMGSAVAVVAVAEVGAAEADAPARDVVGGGADIVWVVWVLRSVVGRRMNAEMRDGIIICGSAWRDVVKLIPSLSSPRAWILRFEVSDTFISPSISHPEY